MTQTNKLTAIPNQPASLIKPVLTGGVTGLILISFFVFGREPNPEWGKLWIIRPLIVVPIAGAMGGVFYYFMDHLSSRGRLDKILAILLSLMVLIIALWLGIILGLNGTMWN